jgi:hypothetical protein
VHRLQQLLWAQSRMLFRSVLHITGVLRSGLAPMSSHRMTAARPTRPARGLELPVQWQQARQAELF